MVVRFHLAGPCFQLRWLYTAGPQEKGLRHLMISNAQYPEEIKDDDFVFVLIHTENPQHTLHEQLRTFRATVPKSGMSDEAVMLTFKRIRERLTQSARTPKSLPAS
jgi:hypothetical protein